MPMPTTANRSNNALGGLTQTGLGIGRQNAGKCKKMQEYPLDSLQSSHLPQTLNPKFKPDTLNPKYLVRAWGSVGQWGLLQWGMIWFGAGRAVASCAEFGIVYYSPTSAE